MNKKDTPGAVITARAFKYAASFYDFADEKFPELKGYPPDNGRGTLLQAAIIVSTLIALERRSKGAGRDQLHDAVSRAFAPSVQHRHLAAIQDLSCSLLQLDRAGLKAAVIPSFAKLADVPDKTIVDSIGLWITHAISKKERLEPGDLKLAAALGRSAWTSATIIVRMLKSTAQDR